MAPVKAFLVAASGAVAQVDLSETAGLLQVQSRSSALSASGTFAAQSHRLREATVELLREGATPAVVTFTKETIEKLEDEVMKGIKDEHDKSQDLIDETFKEFQKTAEHHVTREAKFRATWVKESAASQTHKECRIDETTKCTAATECNEILDKLKVKLDLETEDYSETLHDEGHCPASTLTQTNSSRDSKDAAFAREVLKGQQTRRAARQAAQTTDEHKAASLLLLQQSPPEGCPWLRGTTAAMDLLHCGDGSMCDGEADGWDCCHRRGGRGKCPPNFPYMCQQATCGSGSEHCCTTHGCQGHDGLRECGTAEHCVDKPGWMDKEGDSCDKYASCSDGRSSRGNEHYERMAADGHSALTACCSCGGGDKHKVLPTVLPEPLSTELAESTNAVIASERLGYDRIIKEWKERYAAYLAYETKKVECEGKDRVHDASTLQCNNGKTTLEITSCLGHSEYNSADTTLDEEWDAAATSYENVKDNVKEQEETRKGELEALREVKCILEAVEARGGRACSEEEAPGVVQETLHACEDLPVTDSDVSITYPAVPTKPTLAEPRPWACVDDFIKEEYGHLTGHCFQNLPACVDCDAASSADSPSLLQKVVFDEK